MEAVKELDKVLELPSGRTMKTTCRDATPRTKPALTGAKSAQLQAYAMAERRLDVTPPWGVRHRAYVSLRVRARKRRGPAVARAGVGQREPQPTRRDPVDRRRS